MLLPLVLHHYLPLSSSQMAQRGTVEQGLYLNMDLCSDQCNEPTTLPKPAKERAINVAANSEN